MDTTGQQETEQDTKSVQETSEQKHRRQGKHHPDYWRSRLIKSCWKTDQGKGENWAFSAKIQHAGIRETICLHTANKAEAANRAAKIYLFLLANGWAKTREEFKPKPAKVAPTTLGDYFRAVEAASSKLKPSATSLRIYAGKIRKIVSDIQGQSIRAGEKYARTQERSSPWRETVEAFPLSKLTDNVIERWKLDYIKRATEQKRDPDAAERAANGYLRNAASLFAPGITKHLRGIDIPTPAPLSSIVIVQASEPPAYRSILSAGEILRLAKRDLRVTYPQAYIALLLALCAGLRRSEIDRARWDWINWNSSTIIPTAARGYAGKTKGSLKPVAVDPAVLAEIEAVVGPRTTGYVIDGHDLAEDRSYSGYRCDPHFVRLCEWLRSQGLQAGRLIQSLRQEFGSTINESHGLFAASRALRHSNIKTTAKHYLDSRGKVFVKTDDILGEEPVCPDLPEIEDSSPEPGEPTDDGGTQACPI